MKIIETADHVSLWLRSVKTFRDAEDQTLLKGTYEATLEEHGCALSALIATGERLILAVEQDGLPPDAPFTFDGLKATLESLCDSFRGRHRKCNSEQTNREIAKLFG